MTRLDLFVSFATNTATPTSDIDFVVYGCPDLLQLEDDLQQLETLRKIDIFDFDNIKNEFLLEDIKNMESKSINRYNTFCKSLKNLAKSRTAEKYYR